MLLQHLELITNLQVCSIPEKSGMARKSDSSSELMRCPGSLLCTWMLLTPDEPSGLPAASVPIAPSPPFHRRGCRGAERDAGTHVRTRARAHLGPLPHPPGRTKPSSVWKGTKPHVLPPPEASPNLNKISLTAPLPMHVCSSLPDRAPCPAGKDRSRCNSWWERRRKGQRDEGNKKPPAHPSSSTPSAQHLGAVFRDGVAFVGTGGKGSWGNGMRDGSAVCCVNAERRMQVSCVAPTLVVEARPRVSALPSWSGVVNTTEGVAENGHFGRRRVSHSWDMPYKAAHPPRWLPLLGSTRSSLPWITANKQDEEQQNTSEADKRQ